MTEASSERVREILAAVKPLAAEFYRLTGKPLGVTGEIAEYVAAEILGLRWLPLELKAMTRCVAPNESKSKAGPMVLKQSPASESPESSLTRLATR